MATYNGEKYIREQLDSLAAQTLLPCELVVTDDGSTDLTLEIIAEFALTSPFPINVHKNLRRLGYADNFLKAAGLCRGDLIAFCDQDDIWLERKLAICTEQFSDPEILICVHSSQAYYGAGRFGKYVPHFTRDRVIPAATADSLSNHVGFSTVIRRSLLDVANNNVRPDDRNTLEREPVPMAHDQWIWFIGSIFGKVSIISEVLCLYRQHDNNIFGVRSGSTPLTTRLRLDRSVYGVGGQYRLHAQYERGCACFIEELSTELPEVLQERARNAAYKLRARATLNELRQELYNRHSPLAVRLPAFYKILISSGYFANRFEFSFGTQAFFKDFLLALSGANRFFGTSPKRHAR